MISLTISSFDCLVFREVPNVEEAVNDRAILALSILALALAGVNRLCCPVAYLCKGIA